MKLYKIYSRAIGLLFALSLLCVGCENEDILDINDLEISPSNPESVIIVEPDDGITSVNALTRAINENGDATYILRRDGVYYMEGKNVFKHNVVIKAENGSGKMPIIQPICDAQGALNADMIRLEGSATFENIYIIGKDAATGNLMQRLFRIDESNVRLKFDHCFIDHCRNFCIRTDNVNNKIYLNKARSSKITIGDNFVFTSGEAFNPLCRNICGCMFTVYPSSRITIGDNSGISSACLWASTSITIGNYVKIGGDCVIMDTDAHSLNFNIRRSIEKNEQGYRVDGLAAATAPIIIEDDVLIGTRCIILKGVIIGARTVIGSGSVVTKSIPADCIAAGNPCKVIKYIER